MWDIVGTFILIKLCGIFDDVGMTKVRIKITCIRTLLIIFIKAVYLILDFQNHSIKSKPNPNLYTIFNLYT